MEIGTYMSVILDTTQSRNVQKWYSSLLDWVTLHLEDLCRINRAWLMADLGEPQHALTFSFQVQNILNFMQVFGKFDKIISFELPITKNPRSTPDD